MNCINRKGLYSMRYISRHRYPIDYKIFLSYLKSIRDLDKNESKFISSVSSYLGCNNIKLLNRGRSALYLALKAIGIKPGDKVICPALTCLVVPEMILRTGAVPSIVDVNISTYNIDIEKLKDSIVPDTKAIIPIHLFGNPADMGAIIDLANDKNLFVIEDAAQAMGAEYNNFKVGTFGQASIFSLGHGKNISTMDGGVLCINDESLVKKVNELYTSLNYQNYFKGILNFSYMVGYYIISDPTIYKFFQNYVYNKIDERELRSFENINIFYEGCYDSDFDNSRMNKLLAGVGLSLFTRLDKYNDIRISNANYLTSKIKNSGFVLPYAEKKSKHVFLRYVIRLNRESIRSTRKDIIRLLRSKGIDADVPYYNIKKHNIIYRNLIEEKNFPLAEEIADSMLCVPLHPCLSKEDLDYIADQLNGIS